MLYHCIFDVSVYVIFKKSSPSSDILLDDSGGDGSFHKDGQHVKIVVSLQGADAPRKEVRP